MAVTVCRGRCPLALLNGGRSTGWLSQSPPQGAKLLAPQPGGQATLCGVAIMQQPWGSGDDADHTFSLAGRRGGEVDARPSIAWAQCELPPVL